MGVRTASRWRPGKMSLERHERAGRTGTNWNPRAGTGRTASQCRRCGDQSAAPQKAQHAVTKDPQPPRRSAPRRKGTRPRVLTAALIRTARPPSRTAGDKPRGVHAGDSGSDRRGNAARARPTTRKLRKHAGESPDTEVTPCDAVQNRQPPETDCRWQSSGLGVRGRRRQCGGRGAAKAHAISFSGAKKMS